MTLKDLPTTLPLYTAQSMVLLPRTQLPLVARTKQEKTAIEYAFEKTQRLLGLVQENPQGGHFQKGGLGRIVHFQEGTPVFIILEGLCRFTVREVSDEALPMAQVTYEGYEHDLTEETTLDPLVNRPRLLGILKDYLQGQDIAANWDEIDQVSDALILNSLTMACPFNPLEKQALLETSSLSERYDIMIALMEMAHSPFQKERPVVH